MSSEAALTSTAAREIVPNLFPIRLTVLISFYYPADMDVEVNEYREDF
jgi:hypothetical protein